LSMLIGGYYRPKASHLAWLQSYASILGELPRSHVENKEASSSKH